MALFETMKLRRSAPSSVLRTVATSDSEVALALNWLTRFPAFKAWVLAVRLTLDNGVCCSRADCRICAPRESFTWLTALKDFSGAGSGGLGLTRKTVSYTNLT